MEDVIMNFSRVEDDPFAKIPLEVSNMSTDSLSNWHPSTAQIIMEYTFMGISILKFFLGIAVFLADILLIFLILRYKRLRIKFNMYILHYAITNCCYYVVSPIFLLIHALVATGYGYFIHIYCYVGSMEQIFLLMSLIFALLLALDWTISCFRPQYLNKIGIIYEYKFVTLYIIFGVILLKSFIDCSSGKNIGSMLLDCSMFLIIIFLAAMFYIRRQRILDSDHLKTEYTLWISAIALGSVFPVFALDIVFRLINDFSNSNLNMILFLLDYIASLLSMPAPIYILYYLNQWNKYFKIALDITFKKSVQSYGADNLDEVSDNEEIMNNGAEKKIQPTEGDTNTHTIMVL